MRYHYEKPNIYLSMYGKVYFCNHPVYHCCTLFQIGEKGLAVIQQRFDGKTKSTWWGEVDPWITDDLYLHPLFKKYFDMRSGSPSKGSFFLLRKNHSSFYGKLIKSERGLRVMDEMKISSKFTRMLLSKLAKGVLHKKLGYNVDIQLNELNASISDEKAHVHVSIDADMSKEELMIILKKIGLN